MPDESTSVGIQSVDIIPNGPITATMGALPVIDGYAYKTGSAGMYSNLAYLKVIIKPFTGSTEPANPTDPDWMGTLPLLPNEVDPPDPVTKKRYWHTSGRTVSASGKYKIFAQATWVKFMSGPTPSYETELGTSIIDVTIPPGPTNGVIPLMPSQVTAGREVPLDVLPTCVNDGWIRYDIGQAASLVRLMVESNTPLRSTLIAVASTNVRWGWYLEGLFHHEIRRPAGNTCVSGDENYKHEKYHQYALIMIQQLGGGFLPGISLMSNSRCQPDLVATSAFFDILVQGNFDWRFSGLTRGSYTLWVNPTYVVPGCGNSACS